MIILEIKLPAACDLGPKFSIGGGVTTIESLKAVEEAGNIRKS